MFHMLPEGRFGLQVLERERKLYYSLLVFLILTLFLRLKLAFWVMVGLLVAFAGTVFLLPLVGVTINLISLFGFLVVLGIVVDDAIVIGESAYTEIREHGHSAQNVVNGTMKVAVPSDQHSERFGHPASSQTVTRSSERNVRRKARTSSP